MDRRALGTTIRQQRRLKEISVKDMAIHAGITRGYLHSIEKGSANPSLDVLNKIFDKLQIQLTIETKAMID